MLFDVTHEKFCELVFNLLCGLLCPMADGTACGPHRVTTSLESTAEQSPLLLFHPTRQEGAEANHCHHRTQLPVLSNQFPKPLFLTAQKEEQDGRGPQRPFDGSLALR